MTDQGRRRSPLPPDWRTRRLAVLRRDHHRCRWVEDGQRCGKPATEVDHVNRHDDHSYENLRALCTPHHRRRTALQANVARWSKPTRRAPLPHPSTRHAAAALETKVGDDPLPPLEGQRET